MRRTRYRKITSTGLERYCFKAADAHLDAFFAGGHEPTELKHIDPKSAEGQEIAAKALQSLSRK